MAESTLSIKVDDLYEAVGDYLGLHSDRDEWRASETTRVTRYINGGLSKFYHHALTQIGGPGFQWSFLSPTLRVATVDDCATVELPDDFGAIHGPLRYVDTSVSRSAIEITSESRLMSAQQQTTDSGYPVIAFVEVARGTGPLGQRSRLVLWPTPDDQYELVGNYKLLPDALTASNPYPLGGAAHRDTIIAACLAEAELHGNDRVAAIHAGEYAKLLEGSVAMDMRNRPETFGLMLDPSVDQEGYCIPRDSTVLLYNGVPLE